MIHLKDFGAHVCGPNASTREALQRLEALEHKFLVVVDESGRLIGSITDGDVRRAMLSGAQVDDPVTRCMHGDPVTGTRAFPEENAARLRRVPFLPLVDEGGRIVEILVRGSPTVPIRTALVMAGGAGRRLGDRTRSTPKPLLPVDGKPILDHILLALEKVGVGNIYVAVHYRAEQIAAFVAARVNAANVTLLREQQPLGTAGAIGQLPEPDGEPVLVLNGDVITRVDLSALHEFHVRHGHDGTVAVARYDVEIPYGVIRHSEDGLFESIIEKPTVNHFVAAGIYYLSPEFCAVVPKDRPIDMPELLALGRSTGLSIGLFPIHEYWIDVGRPEDFETAERDLSNGT